jgi:hypothetical protein
MGGQWDRPPRWCWREMSQVGYPCHFGLKDRVLRLFGRGSEPRMARMDTNEFSNGRRVGNRVSGLVDWALGACVREGWGNRRFLGWKQMLQSGERGCWCRASGFCVGAVRGLVGGRCTKRQASSGSGGAGGRGHRQDARATLDKRTGFLWRA